MESIKVAGVELDAQDLRMIQTHYINTMNDVELLTRLAAGNHLGIDEMYIQCKERVKSIQVKLEKMGAAKTG